MNAHKLYEDWLPLYAAGQMNEADRRALELHLDTCEACRSDLDFWQAVGAQVTAESSRVDAPDGLAECAIERIHAPSPFRRAFLRTGSLLRAQVYLVRREMWPASAATMAIGAVVALLAGKVEVIRFIAPLVAAASLAAIFGPDNDPATELTLATPTSPWKVLLARLTLVHCYNMLLALASSFLLLEIISPAVLWTLILGWLGPMTFLSALALLLSLWIGTGNSLAVAYGLWLVQFPRFELVFSRSSMAAWTPVITAYREIWSNPLLLIGLGLLMLVAALWSAGRSVPRLVTA